MGEDELGACRKISDRMDIPLEIVVECREISISDAIRDYLLDYLHDRVRAECCLDEDEGEAILVRREDWLRHWLL